MKSFNTTGVCVPEKHYMVNIQDRLETIMNMVDAGEYFCINRARQYGKTTTLSMLKKKLERTYCVLSLDFQDISSAKFKTAGVFVQTFCQLIISKKRTGLKIPDKVDEKLIDYSARTRNRAGYLELFDVLSEWCEISEKELVLIVDEVDSASNNQIFMDFLAQLRSRYISRETEAYPTFRSVILAGVTDIKHLRSKIRDDDQHRVNSPWNIAADFDIDMSLSAEGIRGMLAEYDSDHHTGMDIKEIAGLIRDYTNGYPFLVSRICQIMDQEITKRMGLSAAWSLSGFDEAIKCILSEKNTLFESLTGKLKNYPEMKKALRSILIEGTRITYNQMQESILQMEMYGFIENNGGNVAVSNRIFETLLYNLYLSEEDFQNNIFGREGDGSKNLFINRNELNMRLVLERFIETYIEVCGPLEDKFKEKDGRELFLLYLKPIINGTGNYYIESQTRDQKRTDVIVDYLGNRYVIELKIWRGNSYNEKGERQISEYLDYFGLDTGYMLSFNFNKNKEIGVKRKVIGNKVLFEGVL